MNEHSNSNGDYNRILYLGLEVPQNLSHGSVIHCPLIAIAPRPSDDTDIQQAFQDFASYTHLVFTSKSAVSLFSTYVKGYGFAIEDVQRKCLIAVGQGTAKRIRACGLAPTLIAKEETAEGLVALLAGCDLKGAYLFWPHAALARPVLTDWLISQHIQHRACVFYDTVVQRPPCLPDLQPCNEIVFTSPSTVDAFLEVFGPIPYDKTLTCIGPITQAHLNKQAKVVKK